MDRSIDEARICLIAPQRPSARLKDALHRIVAELHAAGFTVERVDDSRGASARQGTSFGHGTPPSCRGASGHLWLRRFGAVLSVLATARIEDTPLSQEVDLAERATTAEVIAIRAVESLRAAMIQTMRSSEKQPELSETVRRFTHYDEDAAGRADAPGERPAERSVVEDEGSEGARPEPKGLFALGMGLGVDGGEVGMPGELSASWQVDRVALGAILDVSVLPATWDAAAGSVSLRQYSLLARVAWRIPCGSALECEIGASGGVREVSILATPNTTAEAVSESHTTAIVSGDAFGGYFFEPHWGFGARVRLGSLLNAPALSVGEDDKLWGRPTVTVTALFLARY